MKLKYYQISIRYENKMHDFHGWGVAVQIYYFYKNYSPRCEMPASLLWRRHDIGTYIYHYQLNFFFIL